MFVLRGNVISLAVGVIIGGAFQKIVTSVVNDLIMPWIGALTGNVSFGHLFLIIRNPDDVPLDRITLETAAELKVTTFNYGAFLTAVFDFLIMALVVFLLVKFINRLTDLRKSEPPEEAPEQKSCPFCCTDIPKKAVRCPHCTSGLEDE